MKALHWIETKQLDRVTNFSTEVEIVKASITEDFEVYYYCSFSKEKNHYNLKGNIIYLGKCKNRYIKAIEFNFLAILKALELILKERQIVIMVNQDLIIHMLPAFFLNKLLKKKNRFVVDIRTTPVNPDIFEKQMMNFHRNFRIAVKYFDGFSFITPFMEKYIMENYHINYKSVNWSSGVDINLFKPENYSQKSNKKRKFQIFYHGGISISRGNLDLIKACETLVTKGFNIELLQIGILVDDSIQKYVKKKKIEDWCKLLAPVPLTKIPEYLINCDLPVLPFPYFMGWRVSSPIKLMEYLAMGKKALVPEMESFTDVFGKNSDLVYYYNPENGLEMINIAQAIKRILIDNLVKQNESDFKTRKFVSEKYTWENQASNLFDFCNSL